MACLRVEQPMDGLAVDDAPGADPGADGIVDKLLDSPRSPPEKFSIGSRIDVGVDHHRNLERISQRTNQVGIGPARFGRRRDVAVGWRSSIQVQRAERADADPTQRVRLHVGSKEVDRMADRLGWAGGGKADFRQDILRPAAHHADEFRPTRFDPAVPIHQWFLFPFG